MSEYKKKKVKKSATKFIPMEQRNKEKEKKPKKAVSKIKMSQKNRKNPEKISEKKQKKNFSDAKFSFLRKKNTKKPISQTNNGGEKSHFEIVMGFRRKNRIKNMIGYGSALVVVLALIITNAALPTGISESAKNLYSSLGGGENPAEMQSTNVIDSDSDGSISYLLSDTFFEIFNSRGKEMLYYQHGFSNPEMKLSKSRALVYDRGGYGIKIFNDYQILKENVFDDAIYTADIARNGNTAFVTKASGYAAAVTVYSKNFKKIYSRYSADNLISAVAFNKSGRKLAVSEIYTEGGIVKSKICVFGFKSSAPLGEYVIEGTVVSSIINLGSKFAVISNDGYWVIDWKNCKQSLENKSTGMLFYDANLSDKVAFVTCENNDYSKNKITVLGKGGTAVSTFDYSGVVSGISLGKSKISVLGGDKISVYSLKGKKRSDIDCGYNTYYISSLGGNRVSAFSKSKFYVFKEN